MIGPLVTMAIMGVFFIQPVREYSTQNQWIFWVAFAASFACLIALSCFEGVRRNFPGNLICLGVFTVGKCFQKIIGNLFFKNGGNLVILFWNALSRDDLSKPNFLVIFQNRAREVHLVRYSNDFDFRF